MVLTVEAERQAHMSTNSLDVLWIGVGFQDRVGDLLLFLEQRVQVFLHVARQVAPQGIGSLRQPV